MLKIGILNGDDIGHEIVPETDRGHEGWRLSGTGVAIEWSQLAHRPVPLSNKLWAPPCRATRWSGWSKVDGWVLGPIGHQAYPKDPAPAINPTSDPAKAFRSFCQHKTGPIFICSLCRSVHQDVDLVIVRENNEGFQPDRNVVAGSGEFRPSAKT